MSISRLMMMARAGVPSGSAWTDPDLANASYDSKSFVVASQDATPTDIQFKPDGTKMYICGATTDDVFQYSLSTAWDISTASYDSVNYAPTFNLYGIRIDNNGTKLYTINVDAVVRQSSMSTAWDLSTATDDSVTYNCVAETSSPRDIFFKSDGTKLYIADAGTDKIFQYSLSTAWDISTASYDSVFLAVGTQDTNILSIEFNPDGTKFWLLGGTNQSVYEYDLSTAWDLSTASYASVYFSVSSQAGYALGMTFSSDGAKMYVTDNTGDDIYQYSTTTPEPVTWTDPDLANASYDSVSFNVVAEETAAAGLFFKPDGTKMYTVGYYGQEVNEYALSTAWDITSASATSFLSVSAKDTAPRDVWFKDDGTELYVVGTTSVSVHQYSLSTAWDVSSATFTQSFSVSTEDTFPRGLTFKPDGTVMYVSGTTGDKVYQYSLSTAWDISTASYASKSYSVGTSNPTGPRFSPDGTKLFTVDNSADDVRSHTLTTAWDVSTASYDSISFSVGLQETFAQGLFFKSDGSKMYVVGGGSNTVYQYSTN